MDRFVDNTLRTLGIVLISIFVIGASLILLLFALCLGALGAQGGSFHSPSDQQAFYLSLLGAAVLITGGVFGIIKLSRGIVRETPEYGAPQTLLPPIAEHPIFPSATASSTTELPPTESIPTVPPPAPAEPRPSYSVVTHLRPASRAAIQNLVLAISGKIIAELLLTIAGSLWTYRLRHAPYASFRYSFIVWGFAAAAPMIVLIYALLRHPGPRAFAYSLVIPALHIFFGFFGHSATIFAFFRTTPGISPALPLLSLVPWLLDILILRLAWKAMRLTGIQPNSTRLIVASAVIFIYTSMLPMLMFLLNNFLLRR